MQKIFLNDAATRNFFTYNAIAVRFKKEGKTGYRFNVKDKGTNKPSSISSIVLQPGNIIAATNNKGIAAIELQKDVIYSYSVITPGFNTVAGTNLQPVAGVMRRKTITLIGIAEKTA